MASTTSPISSCSESPIVMTGRLSRSIFSRAISVSGSVPMTVAVLLRPSFSDTLIASAPWMTWLLVSTYPSRLMMTPEPRLFSTRFRFSDPSAIMLPNICLNRGSLKKGWLPTVITFSVLILTTAGAAALTADE